MGCCVSTPIKEEQRSSGVKRDDRATNGDHGTSESANVGDRGDKSSSVDDNGYLLEDPTPNGKERFPLGTKLGEGGFGSVYESIDAETGIKVAVKVIPKARLRTDADREGVLKEVKIMQHLDGHRNIVRVLGAYEDNRSVYVVLELCAGGDMFQRLLSKGHYTERDAAALCRAMLQILQYCHENGVIHRDLKPENFLFDQPGDDSELKATDFGLSAFFRPGEKITKACGTPIYIAPEVIKQNYDEKADVWSIGVILYILLSGKVPFYGKTTNDMLDSTLRGRYHFNDTVWLTVTDDAKKCVERMLTYDPEERVTAQEMLEDLWIVGTTASTTPIVQSVFENVKKFAGMNKLKKRALQLMASNIKMEDMKEVKEAFANADEDNSGTITVDEMRKALNRIDLHLTDKAFEELWNTFDVDGNGEIDYIEFLTATTELNKLQTVENIQHAFAQMDTNGDGRITVSEVTEALRDLGVDEVIATKLLEEADKNKDGVIDYNEFVEMMTQTESLKPNKRKLLFRH